MRAERFRSLPSADGPFASVYYDDSHDTQDANAQLELRWRSIREHVESEGAGAIADVLEPVVLHGRPPVGRSGRGIIAGERGVLLDEQLIRPPAATIVRVSPLPYLLPVVEHGGERHSYIVAAVDHAGADLTIHPDGHPAKETVDAGGYPVHHAGSAETQAYGDPQRAVEAARGKNIRAVTERLTHLVDETRADVVFVVGEVRSRTDLLADLPARVRDRVVELQVGARHSGFDDRDLQEAIEAEFQMRRVASIDDAAQRFHAAHGGGLAAEGLDAVCAALRDGAVDTLIVGELGDATVVAGDDPLTIAPNANVLSELGAAPTRTLRADEALPLAAVAVDADVVRTDQRLEPADGVAAVLRYARSHH